MHLKLNSTLKIRCTVCMWLDRKGDIKMTETRNSLLSGELSSTPINADAMFTWFRNSKERSKMKRTPRLLSLLLVGGICRFGRRPVGGLRRRSWRDADRDDGDRDQRQ